MVKLLCKCQFRERDFQRLLWKCCASIFNTCFMQWFEWFLFCRESLIWSPHGAALWETVLWHGVKNLSRTMNPYMLRSVCPIFDLFGGGKQKENFLKGINKVPLLYELLTNLFHFTNLNWEMFSFGLLQSKECPTYRMWGHGHAPQFAQMKFSRWVRTLLHRKRWIRMKYKPVSETACELVSASPGGNTILANYILIFFVAFLIPLLHVSEQSTLCAVSHDFRLLKCTVFSSVMLNQV